MGVPGRDGGWQLGEMTPSATSLYKRLGGYHAIAAVVDDFVPRLATDAQLGKYFVGASKDSQGRIRQHLVDQVCAATGGPCLYLAGPMEAVHAGLGITESDWQVAVKLLVASLDKFKVPTKEKDELLGAISALKGDIVESREGVVGERTFVGLEPAETCLDRRQEIDGIEVAPEILPRPHLVEQMIQHRDAVGRWPCRSKNDRVTSTQNRVSVS